MSTLMQLIIIFTVAHILMQRVSLWYNILQLNDNVYVHLKNLECGYVTLVLLGLEDEEVCCLVISLKCLDIYACLAYMKYGQK